MMRWLTQDRRKPTAPVMTLPSYPSRCFLPASRASRHAEPTCSLLPASATIRPAPSPKLVRRTESWHTRIPRRGKLLWFRASRSGSKETAPMPSGWASAKSSRPSTAPARSSRRRAKWKKLPLRLAADQGSRSGHRPRPGGDPGGWRGQAAQRHHGPGPEAGRRVHRPAPPDDRQGRGRIRPKVWRSARRCDRLTSWGRLSNLPVCPQ